jgi:hypothetical protein
MQKTIIIVVTALAVAATSLAAETVTTWDFDKDRPGLVPPGFARAAGGWSVTADPTAPSQPNVLAQRAKSSIRTLNLVLVAGTSYRNLDVSVNVRAIGGKEEQGGGVAWRARGGDYYAVRFSPLDNHIRLYKVRDNGLTELGSAEIRHVPGWHPLRVVITDDRLECYYDGKKYLDRRDASFMDAGAIGLWTKGDAETYFDNLTVLAR